MYFQASKGAGPIRSGVDMLPAALVVPPFAMVAGGATQATGKYRAPNVAAWIFISAGMGVLSLLREDSSVAQWVGYQILPAAGIGLLVRLLVTCNSERVNQLSRSHLVLRHRLSHSRPHLCGAQRRSLGILRFHARVRPNMGYHNLQYYPPKRAQEETTASIS